MTRLLNANFARLFKSRLFLICAAVSALIGAGKVIIDIFFTTNSDYANYLEIHLFNLCGIENIIITAVFTCLFIGQEYAGGMRNKIIIGKTRLSVYLANFITSSAATAILYFISAFFLLITAVLFGGNGKHDLLLPATALHMLLQLLSLLGANAVFTALAMLIHHRAASAVAALILLFGMIVAGTSISNKKNELTDNLDYAEGSLEAGFVSKHYNIDDIRSELAALKLAENLTAFGQQVQLCESYTNEIVKIIQPQAAVNEPVPMQIIPYSLGTIAVFTAAGFLVFRRKDLR